MNKFIAPLMVVGMIFMPSYSIAATQHPIQLDGHQVVSHGGGCRKSSPPGQCCHMDNSQGRVHCH